MKNRDIIQLYEGICDLKDLDFNVSVGYIFAKNLVILEPFYKAIKQQQRKLWEKYGQYNEEGNLFVPNDRIDELTKENEELMEIETIVNISKLRVKDLENYNIGLEKLVKIYDMINENPQE